MPPKVAAWLMTEAGTKVDKKEDYSDNDGEIENDDTAGINDDVDDYCSNTEDDNSSFSDEEERISSAAKNDDIRSLFRPFNMHRMEVLDYYFYNNT